MSVDAKALQFYQSLTEALDDQQLERLVLSRN